MTALRFHHPIEVRYGDLDPQGHVNNAKYLTYLEQARVAYIASLGLWRSDSFLDFGVILADVQITFRQPILFGQKVQVGVRVTRLGNKSLTMEYCLKDADTDQELATGSSVLVTFDYSQRASIPLPESWRQTILEFEGLASS